MGFNSAFKGLIYKLDMLHVRGVWELMDSSAFFRYVD